MGSSAKTEYCAFTKAIEHLGDRWSLLIVRELFMFGPQGFNSLATGLPGRVSRSVLSDKLRKLEDLGLVARDLPGSRRSPYRLAPAGMNLVPTMKSLWNWAERWVPEDPSLAQRDPTVIAFWLSRRAMPSALPESPAVIELAIGGPEPTRSWILLEHDKEPELCADDPMLDPDRYVYVEAEPLALLPVARGERGLDAAILDRSIEVYGQPGLIAGLPTWFTPMDARGHPSHRAADAA